MVQAVREALQYLSWENSALSVKVLDAVFSVCKKADAQALYQLAPVRLLSLADCLAMLSTGLRTGMPVPLFRCCRQLHMSVELKYRSTMGWSSVHVAFCIFLLHALAIQYCSNTAVTPNIAVVP